MPSVALKQVPLLDLQAQHRTIREEILETVTRVIDSQRFILGDEVVKLESSIAEYCGTKFAVGCASGSDALFLALLGLDIGPGDKVLTTPYSFFATVGSIARAGATPVFCDIDPETFNIDVKKAEAAIHAHPEIRAIIPIHLFGGCADMDALRAVAGPRVKLIEDAAQSIGAEYKGRRAGRLGDVACFSFFPSKNLGGYGDAGMLTTDDAALAEKLAALRVHGEHQRYYHDWIGINSRIDALQAAVLSVKLRHLDKWTEGRRRTADLYRAALAGVPVRLPEPAEYQTRYIYNQFVIRAERRDELQEHLKQAGIGTAIYYPLPLHLQKCFEHFGGKPGDYPESEALAKEALALPIYAELSADDIDYVSEAIAGFYR
jgi:dTDP-4-amino-4,6-dideoxygalactose transaminase